MSKKHRSSQLQNRSQQLSTSQNKSLSAGFQFHRGPLPSPKDLDEYDKIVPGAAERIISMAEEQAKHRQGLEKVVIESDIKDSKTGLYFGFIIGLVAIISGTICIVYGHSIAGGVLGGSAVPGLAAVFVYGSRQRRREREAKQQQISAK